MSGRYKTIAYELESKLGQMRLEGKMRLPSEDELCQRYSCSRQTVRSALDLMAGKGLIVKRKGSGSYISEKITKSNKVFLIVEDEDEYTNPDFISSLKPEIKKHGYDLICISTEGSYDKERDAFSRVISEDPSAVIIEPISDVIPNHNRPLIEAIDNKDIPVIYLYSAYPYPKEAVCIKEDDKGGIRALVSYLKDKGHTDIACAFRIDDSRGLTRYKNFVDSLHENGLHFKQQRAFFFTSKERKAMLTGDEEFLLKIAHEIRQDASAIVCHNDELAFRLQEILKRERRSDIEVVSFDNSYYAASSSRITSLGHKRHDILKAITDAVCKRGYIPSPVKWHIHIRNSY
ncbi:MAG: GntR family transcriptional regulator [Saccharofermentans sp.]|nr:GntR family transcriptional regulator [Saccharofermentans sp.]